MERILTKRLLYEFDNKYDRFDGEKKKNLRLEDKLSVLNEAQTIVFENRIDFLETTHKFRNSLLPFEVKEKTIKIKEKKDKYVVAEFPKNFYLMSRQRAVIRKKSCGKDKEVPITIFKSDKLDDALRNTFWQPSYEWEMVLGDEGSKGLYVWSNGDFDIKEIIIDYYRKPDELHAPSMTDKRQYEDWNGVLRKRDVNCEFSQNYDYRRIVDIAILIATANLGNTRDFQLQLNSILNKENYNF